MQIDQHINVRFLLTYCANAAVQKSKRIRISMEIRLRALREVNAEGLETWARFIYECLYFVSLPRKLGVILLTQNG